jgi:hypothetical protein
MKNTTTAQDHITARSFEKSAQAILNDSDYLFWKFHRSKDFVAVMDG